VDAGVDAGMDAGSGDPPCDHPDSCYCEGSASTCLQLDDDPAHLACLPQGQYKARFEVTVTPADWEGAPDSFAYPMADSWNCIPIDFTEASGFQVGEVVALPDGGVDGGTDAGVWDLTEAVRISMMKEYGSAYGDHGRFILTIEIPIENYYDGAILNLGTDPTAFKAWLAQHQLATPLWTEVEAAWILATAFDGVIEIENAAEPCAGDSSCPTATGTMEIDFVLVKAELDPDLFL
jgi:hypothetical protein